MNTNKAVAVIPPANHFFALSWSERILKDIDRSLYRASEIAKDIDRGNMLTICFVGEHVIRNADMCCGTYDHGGYCTAHCEDSPF